MRRPEPPSTLEPPRRSPDLPACDPMKIVRPATAKHPVSDASPEAMIEERLERVRARANILRAERAFFDCLAALLAA